MGKITEFILQHKNMRGQNIVLTGCQGSIKA